MSGGVNSAVAAARAAEAGHDVTGVHLALPSRLEGPRPGRRPQARGRWPARPGAPVVDLAHAAHHRLRRARGAAAGRADRRRPGDGGGPRTACPGSTGWSTPSAAEVRARARRRAAGLGRARAAARPPTCSDAGREGRRRVGRASRCPRARDAERARDGRAAPPSAPGIARIDAQPAASASGWSPRLGDPPRQPWIYLIVATGDIYEDIPQAQAAAREGADVIAVIRSTGQSLLDYVPEGATREGYAGTYATQENFRLMRAALDDVERGARPLRPADQLRRRPVHARDRRRWPGSSGST